MKYYSRLNPRLSCVILEEQGLHYKVRCIEDYEPSVEPGGVAPQGSVRVWDQLLPKVDFWHYSREHGQLINEHQHRLEAEHPQLAQTGAYYDEDGFLCYGDEKLDPYEHITWAVGNAEDFICFDFIALPLDHFGLEATMNMESGDGALETFRHQIVKATYGGRELKEAAEHMVQEALEWCYDMVPRWNKERSRRQGRLFVRAVEQARHQLVRAGNQARAKAKKKD